MAGNKANFPFPTNKVWVNYNLSQSRVPSQMKIEGVKNSEHGTYKSRPYYIFVEIKATGKKMLISSSGLRAELTYIPGSRKINTAKNLGAQFKISVENVKDPAQFENAILSYNDESADELSFVVQGTPPGFSALPSGRYPYGHYLPSKKLVSDFYGNKETFGDIFTHKVFAFDLLLRSWDLTKLDVDNFQQTGNEKKLFMLPGGETMDFDQQGDTVIPYGWIYETRAGGTGSEYSHMASSGSDIMNSVQKGTGYKISGGVDVNVGPVQASANFSVAKNESVLEKVQNMYEKEQTYSEHKYVETECAFVLDKRNVALNDFDDDGRHYREEGGFRKAIKNLQVQGEKAPNGRLSDQQLLDFIAAWGTHYAYAATFGAKGSAVMTYSKEHVKQLINKKVDVQKAWSAGVSVKVFGSGANIDYSNDSADAREKYQQLEDITGDGFTSFSCVGGGTCDMGKPSGGERVPIYMDLRPISELLGPPFYNDELTAINLRAQLEDAIQKHVFKPSAENAEVISVSEIEFTAIRTSVGSYMREFGSVSIDGPYLSFPPGDLIGKKGSIELNYKSSGDGFKVVDGISARFYHKHKPFEIEVELSVSAHEEDFGRIAGRDEWGGWYEDNKLLITIDPSKEGKQTHGPFVCQKKNRFKEQLYDEELATVVEFSFEMIIRKVDYKSLLGFSI